MLLLLIMVFISLSPAVEGPVFGDLQSAKNLTISSDLPVKDITWILEVNGKETRVAKIKDGKLVQILSNMYWTFNNGRVLNIPNLTTNDSRCYVASMTLLDDTVIKEVFNLTVHVALLWTTTPGVPEYPEPTLPTQITTKERNEEKKTSYVIWITVSCTIIVGALVVALLVCKCKKSSNTTGQDDPHKENGTNQIKMWLSGMTSMFTRMKSIWQQVGQDDEVLDGTDIERNPGPSDKYFKAEKNQSSRIHLDTVPSCDVPTGKAANEETDQQIHEKEEQDKLIQKKRCFGFIKAKL